MAGRAARRHHASRPSLTARRLLSAVLAVTLIVTAQALATARAQPAPVGTVVICAGQGLVTVAVDAEGQPIGPPHACPDGALALMDACGPATLPHRAAEVSPATLAAAASAPHIPSAFVAFAARAPPHRL